MENQTYRDNIEKTARLVGQAFLDIRRSLQSNTPSEKIKIKMFDFHQWLLVDGCHVDISFEQCKTVSKGNEGKIVFDAHPLIGSDDYIFEGGNAVMEEPFVVFSNFVMMNYFRSGK